MPTDDTSLEGRVALVTGGGRGLGRAHALRLARHGAAVVVNDVGAALDGRGIDAAPAREVADEIVAAGGRAVADTTDVASIAGGAHAVEVAVDAFGRIDVVVNNAGFAAGGGGVERPVDAELDALFDVHFKAAVGTTSAAFPIMRAQGYGRVVNTVSEVALDVRFGGGLGYGAAKAALWSATLSAARAAEGTGVTVNGISPGARTRMSAAALDAGFRDAAAAGSVPERQTGSVPERQTGSVPERQSRLDLDPDHVARVVAYLASPAAADVNGRIIHAAAGQLREYTTTRTSRSDLVARLESALT